MTDTLQFDRIPSTLPLFARLAVSKGRRDKTLKQPLVAQARGIVASRKEVRRYVEICGGEEGLGLPILYPQVLTNPLAMTLLAHPDFPLAALGVVHVENEVEQVRAPRVGETLDFRVSIDQIERTARGYEFDMLTEVLVGAQEPIWKARARILSRARDPNAAKTAPPKRLPPQPSDWPLLQTFSLPGNQGRRYARVSGDYNPIHLYTPTARLLGFRKPIIHGMWSAAACAAALGVGDGPCRFSCEFKTPLYLPGKANLHARSAASGRDFVLQEARSFKPVLAGRYEPRS